MTFKNRASGKFHQAVGFLDRESRGGTHHNLERPGKLPAWQMYLMFGIGILLTLVLLGGTFYLWYISGFEISPTVQIRKINNSNPWYAVKLVDGEIVYGKITDINTDPLVIESVYYNYDQKIGGNDSEQKKAINEAGDLRLVKRGNETHGPDGKLQVFRAQVVFMENLRADSGVLRVIEENEK